MRQFKRLLEFLPDVDDNVALPSQKRATATEMADQCRKEGRPNMYDHDWKPLLKALDLPWFYRKWVIQEVALAQKAMLYIRGGIQLPWEHLSNLAYKIESLDVLPAIAWKYGQKDRRSLELALRNINVIREIPIHRAVRRGTLVDAVLATAGSSCSNARDHIYAVRSCALEGPRLEPQYELPVEDIFKRFTEIMLTEGQSLKVLSVEPHKENSAHPDIPRLGLPTWVSDVRRQAEHMVTVSVYRQNFYAGGSGKPMLRFSEDGRSLHCQGLIVDTMEESVDSLHEILMRDVPELF